VNRWGIGNRRGDGQGVSSPEGREPWRFAIRDGDPAVRPRGDPKLRGHKAPRSAFTQAFDVGYRGRIASPFVKRGAPAVRAPPSTFLINNDASATTRRSTKQSAASLDEILAANLISYVLLCQGGPSRDSAATKGAKKVRRPSFTSPPVPVSIAQGPAICSMTRPKGGLGIAGLDAGGAPPHYTSSEGIRGLKTPRPWPIVHAVP